MYRRSRNRSYSCREFSISASSSRLSGEMSKMSCSLTFFFLPGLSVPEKPVPWAFCYPDGPEFVV